ncbi:MAG: alpha/beta fold hydrolase [Nocardioides sp.]
MSERFERAGLTFDLVDIGPAEPTAGPPSVVVLLHGFPQRASCWEPVVPLLSEAGLRVLAPDQRGYSPGARPAGRAAYAMTQLVADARALIEHADAGSVHVVGHDWGALVGWALAAAHPDLVRSFTAVSVPHPGAIRSALWSSGQARKSWYIGAFQVPWLPEYVARRAPWWIGGLLRRSGMRKPALRRFRTEILDEGAFGYAVNWYRAIGYGGPPGTASPVTVPTTLVWSDGDVAVTRAAVDRCEAFVTGDYRLEVLHGVSHWIPEHAPGAVARIVLERVRAS